MFRVIQSSLLISFAFGFRSTSRITSKSIHLKMLWSAKETNEHFLIAPSILSADFARLGEEVMNQTMLFL